MAGERILHAKEERRLLFGRRSDTVDYPFLLLVLLLLTVGLTMLYSASYAQSEYDTGYAISTRYLQKQAVCAAIGLVAMFFFSRIPAMLWYRLAWPLYGVSIVLLLSVLVIGEEVNGAKRWIEVAGIRFQPSETAKIFLILFYAQFIMKYKEKLNTFKILFLSVVLFLPPWLLIYKQPDLSTSIMVLLIFAVILFIGGLNNGFFSTEGLSYKIVGGIFAIVIPLTIIFFSIVLQPDQTLIEPYQQTRILAWLHPEEYSNTQGYQQANSMMAIGSGMLMGKGLNNNVIASVKNGNFIPEPQTDFIFAVIGEELGFIGAATVIILAFLIALECVMAAKRAKDLAGTIICAGVATIIGCQSFLNISVATGLMPNTGIPLPFVSYGLTSLLSSYIGIGLVLNVRLQGRK